MIGTTVGKYRILTRLGRGGMGTVYKAVDETLDREVAVKVLNSEVGDARLMARFRAEATTLARLNHPEIATIYEIYRTETDLLMVMELVRGETLDQLLVRSGPLSPERAAYLVAQLLKGLGYAHRAGIVHRDLKPANIMITEAGTVKIMDFGIARVLGAEHLTSDGTMMGTPAYMAPEQVLGKEIDARADLYSSGVVFYRLLCGSLPFQADTPIGMVHKQLSDPPTPVRTYREDLPEWCETILTRALAKAPADRFQTADEFRAALLSAIGHSTGAFAADTTAMLLTGLVLPGGDTSESEAKQPTWTHQLTPTEFAAAPTATIVRHPTPPPNLTPAGQVAPVFPTSPQAPAPPAVPVDVPPPAPTPAPLPVVSAGAPVAREGSAAVAAALTDTAVAASTLMTKGAGMAVTPTLPEAAPENEKALSPAATESRTRYWIAAGSLAAVIVIVAVVAFAMRGGSTPPAPPQAASTVAEAPAGSTADAPAETPPAETTETTPPAADAPTAASNVVPVATNGADAAAIPPKPATAARTGANAPPVATTPKPVDPVPAAADATPAPPEPASPPEVPAPSAASLLPAFQFSAQTVVVEDGKNRQRDTNVELANGVVMVMGKDNKLVTTVPYDAVVGFTYSNSKQPMWNTEQGPAEIVHLDTGAFSLFRGDQHWLALRTEHMSLVLRVRDQESRRIIAALEERLGRSVERVKNR